LSNNSAINKIPVLNKIINKNKVKGDEGRPFKRVEDDYTIGISKDTYISIFEIKTKVELENIYQYINNFIELKDTSIA